MGSPFIFSGNDSKSLKNNLDLNGNAKILSGSVDPTQTATNAPLGSMYLSTLTGQLYKKKDAGSSTNWEKLLGSQVSNIKNYIGFNNFENNATTGWSLAHSALTSLVPTSTATAGTAFDSTHGGTAANGNLSISAVSSGKLAGLYSGSLAASSASVAGDMLVSQAYSIDLEDQAKVLAFKFYYSATSNASNANWSGTSSNTLQVWIYDVTNGAWIQPAGCYNLVQSSGVGIAQGTFQTPSNMTQFQIALISVNASSGAFTVLVDDFYVGPQAQAFGPPVTDPVAYTPTLTNLGNAAASQFYNYRVGKYAYVTGIITIGSSLPTGTLTFSLPSGMVPDTTYTKNGFETLGYANGGAGGVNNYVGAIFAASSTTASIVGPNTTSWNATVPATWANGNTIEVFLKYPVAGFSSNTVMSADSDTRVCAARYGNTAGTSIPSGSATQVPFATKTYDTHSAFSSNVYTVQIPGKYKVSASVNFASASWAASNFIDVNLRKNGSNVSSIGFTCFSGTTTVQAGTLGSDEIDCITGDTLDITVFQNSGGARTLSTDSRYNYITIERLSGPAVVAASETIGATIYRNATQSQSTASLDKVLIDTVDNDSHGAFSSANNRYVAPAPGRYLVTAQVSWQANATGTRQSYVYINGVSKARCVLPPVTGGDITLTITKLFKLSAGDYVEIFAQQTSGGALNIEGGTEWTFLSVERIGN
jgi:hypothetical protein